MTSSKPLPGGSLGDLFPDLAVQWHPTKNYLLTAFDVTPSSGKKVWWLGECGHEWDAPPTSRTLKNSGCPICANKRVVAGINDLAIHHPEIATEWHPTKNGNLKPTMITSGSAKRVWWLAQCGHEWQVAVSDRVLYSTGCPYCHGNSRVLVGINDLASINPGLAREWHPTKNESLKPTDVKPFSGKKVWWLGECGHEWQSTVAHRSGGRQCPFCTGKKILLGFNDLCSSDPEIAAQWHPTKNNHLSPQMVSRGSSRKVWWLDHAHEWKATINSRTISGQGCAICTGDQVQIGINDLASIRPDVSRQWHPTKNGAATPHTVTIGSGKKYWWLGPCGHTWKASVSHLASGRGCAVCRGLQIEVGVNDLASQYPEVAAEWHPTKNGDLTPEQVTVSSARKVWWLCENGHEWRVGINGRGYGAHGCPSCSNYGFSPSREGWLYFLSHPIWKMQQIGISNVPEKRLAQHAGLGWKVMEVRGPMDGTLTQALERQGLISLHIRGAKLGTRLSHGKFDGHTESWPTESLELTSLRQLLDWVYDDDSPLTWSEYATQWSVPAKQPREVKPVSNCKVEGCGRKHHGYGLCKLHYRRWLKTGETGPIETLKAPNGSYLNKTCEVPGCDKPARARGYCTMHYTRWSQSGDVGGPQSSVIPEFERICIVDDCTTTWFAREMCELHYRRFMSSGDPLITRQGGKPKSYCSIDDCDSPAFGRGLCNMHYKRFRKYGDPHQKGRGASESD